MDFRRNPPALSPLTIKNSTKEHGLVHALGPGSGVGVFDASVPPQGGSNRGGVNGPYLGVLLSYVVWELTG